jgi:hypothetical protein
MEKACLVTGKPGPLFGEIVRTAVGRGRNMLVTRSGHMGLDDSVPESVETIAWNRRSALSARSVLMHAINTFGRLDEAIVVYSPAEDLAPFHESSIVGIEDRVDAEIKGYLFILREILAQFVRQGHGRLALVFSEPADPVRSPLESSGAGSFVSLADSLDRVYSSEELSVVRCHSDGHDTAGFADLVLDRLDARPERRSRWHHFASRSGLFSRRQRQ